MANEQTVALPNRERNNGGNSDNLVDVDLDASEAIAVAPAFLPETGFVFGRTLGDEPSPPRGPRSYQ